MRFLHNTTWTNNDFRSSVHALGLVARYCNFEVTIQYSIPHRPVNPFINTPLIKLCIAFYAVCLNFGQLTSVKASSSTFLIFWLPAPVHMKLFDQFNIFLLHLLIQTRSYFSLCFVKPAISLSVYVKATVHEPLGIFH